VFLSIIIPTCDRNDLLEKCLQCLAPEVQTMNNYEYEVIVTDDSKKNIAKAFVEEKFSWVMWVEGPKRGPAANRNNGAKHARGEWLVFVDDDVVPDIKLLVNYRQAILDAPEVSAFEGAILPDDWNKLREDMAECPVNIEGGCFWSANICIEKNLFKQVNGFDERYLIAAHEDQHIYRQIKEFTLVPFLKKAFVTHPVRLMSLRKKIRNLNVAFKNHFLYKENDNLNFYDLFLGEYKFHFRCLINCLKCFKIKSSIYHSYIFFFTLPLTMVQYSFKSRS